MKKRERSLKQIERTFSEVLMHIDLFWIILLQIGDFEFQDATGKNHFSVLGMDKYKIYKS